MEYKDYKKRLESHIEALEKAYQNTIELLNDDIQKDENGKIKMTESQRKNYIESVQKSAVASNDLITMIRDKYSELEALNMKQTSGDNKKEEVKVEENQIVVASGSALNEHLE